VHSPIFKKSFLSTLLPLCLALLSISATVSANDTGEGKAIFDNSCASCHGPLAQGNDALGGPALAGQYETYLSRQLEHFSNGVRGADKTDRYGQQMAAISAIIKSSKARANVSAYLSSLSKPSASVNNEKTANGTNNGYKVYQASCGACHGADASGNERLNSPSLVGLSATYLSRQYANYLDGKRGSHESDKLGRQMKIIAGTLSDQAKIDSVIAYIVSLQD